ncbi:DedA family protein [Paenibacillus sp. MWE-103]|uniref:DedA family protein n=1 Tax=Paenibacillus artemisiicola TaxID=1172618 RepID=A0ABS3W427_9BACL|nr:DedA family protein [Paenibacillus artemisiicola]MBO7743064.1 DedA family protein [Paenibacillus artemisiicola]
MDYLTNLLAHYGYGLVFLFLCLEMLALPLPGEMMMSLAGLSVYEQKLSWFASIASASAGVLTGVTLSYWIGYRLGRPFIARYGHRVHLTEARMDKMTRWFGKYGDKLLFVAYFIPGIRHMTGYFCGMTRMPFRRYALFAYAGAVFWAGLFITLGKVLGPKWEAYHAVINHDLILIGAASAILAVMYDLYRKSNSRVGELLARLRATAVRRAHACRNVRLLLLPTSYAAFEWLSAALRTALPRLGPVAFGVQRVNTLPSGATLISLTVCGCSALLLLRSCRHIRVWVGLTAMLPELLRKFRSVRA